MRVKRQRWVHIPSLRSKIRFQTLGFWILPRVSAIREGTIRIYAQVLGQERGFGKVQGRIERKLEVGILNPVTEDSDI